MTPIDTHVSDRRIAVKTLADIVGQLKNLVAAAHRNTRRLLRRQLVDDLLDWGQKYLPDHFSRPPSKMHRWLADQLDAARDERGAKLNVLGPRGGAKSTIGTLALPLRAAVECSENYIWIVSDTKRQACAHLENIKAELIENSRLAGDFPDVVGRGPVWRGNLIVLRNGVTIEAFGTGQRIRGRRYRQYRPTLIVCDDLQNDGHTLSAIQREHSRSWFHGTLMKAGAVRTNVINLATALHRDAIAMELHRTPGWNSRLFKAIDRWPTNISLWEQWEAIYSKPDERPDLASPIQPSSFTIHPSLAARQFYDDHRNEMDAGAKLLWPEAEDLYTLMCMRIEGGRTAFEREKQNSPINPDLCEWPESYFDESIWFDTWPTNLVVKTMALDPSKGADSRRGDYSALVVLGLDRHGTLYVEADLARRPTPQIVADGAEWFRRHQPDLFGVEANQFQDLLAAEFESEFRRQSILAARPMPIENHTSKQVRIRRLGPYLSSRRMRFRANSSGTRLLIEQLQQFPIADHDDGPDALEMALRLAAEILNTRTIHDHLGSRLPVG